MKMPLSRIGRRRNALISSSGVAITLGIVSIVGLFLLIRFTLPDAFFSVVAPVWRASDAVSGSIGSFGSLFGNAGSLAAERDQLAARALALEEENRTLRAKVADLQTLVGQAREPEHRILAGVLARPPVAPYDTLVVDTGSAKGVTKGALAYGPGGVPLGTVVSVSSAFAQIELFSTGGRATNGWVGEKRIPITLTGRGAGAFEATLPRDTGIAVNDVVYVPGPGALPIGTVVKVDSNPSSPRATIHVAPYANLFSLIWVEIAPS